MGRGWVAPPIQDRDLHETPLPRLGGIPILLSFLISIAVAFLAGLHFPALAVGPSIRTLLTILVPGTLIFLLGIYDDIHSVGPYTKFAVQAVAAIMLFAGGLRILSLPVLFGARHLAWPIGLPITVLWVIGITNAFNLIDGLDGLAAGSALFSTLVVFVVVHRNSMHNPGSHCDHDGVDSRIGPWSKPLVRFGRVPSLTISERRLKNRDCRVSQTLGLLNDFPS